MRVLVLKTYGYKLANNVLRLETGEVVDPRQYTVIEIVGEGLIDLATLGNLYRSGVKILFKSSKGVAAIPTIDEVKWLKHQLETYLDQRWRLETAKHIVHTSHLAKTLHLRYHSRELQQQYLGDVSKYVEKLWTVDTVQKVRQVEAKIAKTYFQYLRQVVPSTYNFRGRTRRPPRDPVNAVISYLNTLLYKLLTTYIAASKLNPQVGYLHRLYRKRPSLSLDIAELFKPITTEYLATQLAKTREIREDDYEVESTGAVKLSNYTKQRLMKLLRYHLTRPIGGIELEKWIQEEIQELKNCIQEKRPYVPKLENLLTNLLTPHR
ncbi:MAG: CRISPR-associated endonuclease Cas1 [Thermoprotei archaeon]|nr:MAG: CRISPR-associated endonuclease Cas1 [Thermoprotei archaeon]